MFSKSVESRTIIAKNTAISDVGSQIATLHALDVVIECLGLADSRTSVVKVLTVGS